MASAVAVQVRTIEVDRAEQVSQRNYRYDPNALIPFIRGFEEEMRRLARTSPRVAMRQIILFRRLFDAADGYYQRVAFGIESATYMDEAAFGFTGEPADEELAGRATLINVILQNGGVVAVGNVPTSRVNSKMYVEVRKLYASRYPNGPEFFGDFRRVLAQIETEITSTSAPDDLVAPLRQRPEFAPPPPRTTTPPGQSIVRSVPQDFVYTEQSDPMIITNRRDYARRVPLAQFLATPAALRQFNREYNRAVQVGENTFVAPEPYANREEPTRDEATLEQKVQWGKSALGEVLESNNRLYVEYPTNSSEQARRVTWLRTGLGRHYEGRLRSKQSRKQALNTKFVYSSSRVSGMKLNSARV